MECLAPTYDLIIAGGGLAGLSLAVHLINSPLRDRSILIVDQDVKANDDRTWSFWTNRPTLFDAIVQREWPQLQLFSAEGAQLIDLHDYRYRTIRGIDFYQHAHRVLLASPNVRFLYGRITAMEDGHDAACVTVGDQVVRGRWVFDSTYHSIARGPRHHHLKMHFKGWEIETTQPAFNPRAATFLDFRTLQNGATRFFYVLPLSEQRAVVEYTVFSTTALPQSEYTEALAAYLKNTLSINAYRIAREEGGVIPITDQPFPRRLGRHIMSIGTHGGRIKPTTGFAFTRIQRDSAAIVESLIKHDLPFDVPRAPRRYQWYDTLLLDIMLRRNERIPIIFNLLFKRNPIERILRFLDEEGTIGENVRLMASLPPLWFIPVIVRWTLHRMSP